MQGYLFWVSHIVVSNCFRPVLTVLLGCRLGFLTCCVEFLVVDALLNPIFISLRLVVPVGPQQNSEWSVEQELILHLPFDGQ